MCDSCCWLRSRERCSWCGLWLVRFINRVVGPWGARSHWCNRGLGLCEGWCLRCGLLVSGPPGGGKSGIEGGDPKVLSPSHCPSDLVPGVCGQWCVLLVTKVGRGLATRWGRCDLLLVCGLVEGICLWGREWRGSLSGRCGRMRK